MIDIIIEDDQITVLESYMPDSFVYVLTEKENYKVKGKRLPPGRWTDSFIQEDSSRIPLTQEEINQVMFLAIRQMSKMKLAF